MRGCSKQQRYTCHKKESWVGSVRRHGVTEGSTKVLQSGRLHTVVQSKNNLACVEMGPESAH